jgi:ABC-type transporter Mla maintaining outer membrane lipid asymmetry ATPase subunit MlaF
MQKRVALARALTAEPEVLLVDSPTAGLDPILTAIIDSLIVASLNPLRATALTITQDIESARRTAQRAALLSQGRIAWEGPIEMLPVWQRQIVLQVGLDRATYEDTASMLGIPGGTVRSRLGRAREPLHDDRLSAAGAPR